MSDITIAFRFLLTEDGKHITTQSRTLPDGEWMPAGDPIPVIIGLDPAADESR